MAITPTPSQPKNTDSERNGQRAPISPILRAARAKQADFSNRIAGVFARLGIHEEPIVPAIDIRARMVASGRDPNQRDFSQDIVSMREE